MKIIVPMAGIGKRMRPHTLSVPKPLLKIAGKTIVERLIEEISIGGDVDEVHFIIGNFGEDVETALIELAKLKGAKGFIHYQKEALGTAHAIFCAVTALEGDVVIAFADTLFIGDFSIHKDDEAIIWTKIVKNPEAYGVVKETDDELITDFVEKPKTFVSEKAIIGIYYFREAEHLRDEIEFLLENNIRVGKEYQLTDALKRLLDRNIKIKSRVIDEWLDCGNKDEYLRSCIKILEKKEFQIEEGFSKENKIIEPVYIGKNVKITDSKVGPNVSIEDNSQIVSSTIEDTMIGSNTNIENSKLKDSIVGNNCYLKGGLGVVNFGDYIEYESK
jgi:glucose-1-phosphate thymidylyltransferase